MTTNHPANGPVSLDRLHQISEILSKAAAQSDGGNLGYAMADAVKVIDGAIAARNAEPVAWIAKKKTTGEMELDEPHAKATNPKYWTDAFPVYTTPQAPVVPEEMFNNIDNPYGDEDLIYEQGKIEGHNACRASILQHGVIPNWVPFDGQSPYDAPYKIPSNLRELISEEIGILFSDDDAQGIWNACRSAMLQAGSHTEQNLDMVDHSGDANEKVEPVIKPYKLPFDQWLSQQNEPIDVDCGCVTTEAFYHWLRVAYEAGSSPEALDGWISVSERMPEREAEVQVYCADTKEQMVGYMERNEAEGWFRFASLPNGGGVYCKPTHWMSLPAAPQQEVK